MFSKNARFVALDSSHLGNLARDLRSDASDIRAAASSLWQELATKDNVPVLCFHHFQELLHYPDQTVVERRLELLRTLPLVAVVANERNDGVPGSIVDLQIAEIRVAYDRPGASPSCIRDIVAPKLFRLMTGKDAVSPFLVDAASIASELARSAARTREIVAISRSEFAGVAHRKVREFLRGGFQSKLDIQRNMARLEAALQSDIQSRGDRKIGDANAVAAQFMTEVSRIAQAIEGMDRPGVALLALWDIDESEILPGTTIGEAGDWAVFRRKLRNYNRTLNLPWPELKFRVTENRIPSGLIDAGLRKYRPREARTKGSDQIDTLLACLSAYCGLTLVDKRTHEGLKAASNRMNMLAGVIKRVERAKDLATIVGHLNVR